MSLATGTRLGPYEVLSPLGAGGMGEVYRARDTRLGREVAVKVLPAGAAADPDQRRRFEQEARAASALAHPNICVLYDVGSESGLDFLVMEYLEGTSIAERLVKGALPTSQALEIGLQIASALDKAHRAGIVHRDLKPGNVMLTKSGAKLLDFGLAKLRPGGIPSGENESAVSTRDSPITREGTILGTLPYMSPEQLEGKAVDGRSDLFSFGAMLYEMLTGRRAFTGTSSATLVTAIMSSDPPPVSTLAPLTPPGLDRVVRKCLAKDPDSRWQSAADLADELRWLSSGSGSTSGPLSGGPTARGSGRAWRWAAGAAAVLALVAAGGAWWAASRRESPKAAPDVKHTQITFSGDVRDAALSSDGRTVAYMVGTPGKDVKVLVRDLGAGQPLQVWEGQRGGGLTWTPDGLYLLLVAWPEGKKEGSVILVPRLGGSSRTLFSSPEAAALAISPDGKRVAVATGASTGVEIVTLDSRKRDRIPLPDARFMIDLDWSPVTDRLTVVSLDRDTRRIVTTVRPDGSDLRRVYSSPTDQVTGAFWSRREDVLYLQRDRGEVTEILRLPTSGKEAPPEVLVGGLAAGGRFQVSGDGQILLHRRTTTAANLYRVDLEARGKAPVAITQGTWSLESPSVSPDGRWVAATRGKEIVRFPIGGGEPVVLTNGTNARWSPDGQKLAFASERGGTWRPWLADADGQQAREVTEVNDLAWRDVVWLSDRKVAWHRPDNRDYRIRDLETGKEETLVKDPSAGFVFTPCLSPEGDRIAVWWNRTPGLQGGLWLISWPGREEQLVAPDVWPFGWSADGKWIYASSMKSRELVRVSVGTHAVETVASFKQDQEVSIEGCTLTRDRKSAICSLDFTKTDVWMIEHFDPHVPPQGR